MLYSTSIPTSDCRVAALVSFLHIAWCHVCVVSYGWLCRATLPHVALPLRQRQLETKVHVHAAYVWSPRDVVHFESW